MTIKLFYRFILNYHRLANGKALYFFNEYKWIGVQIGKLSIIFDYGKIPYYCNKAFTIEKN